MYNHRLPGHPHITIPPGAGPPVSPSPQGYHPYDFELNAPSGDLSNPWEHLTPTTRQPNARPNELRSRSRAQSAYEPAQATISFPEPDLHRFSSQRTTLRPNSPRYRSSKSDDGHDFLLQNRDQGATASFSPVTPSSASSIHYLHEDDVRCEISTDNDVF
jgi:hypothetical protein